MEGTAVTSIFLQATLHTSQPFDKVITRLALDFKVPPKPKHLPHSPILLGTLCSRNSCINGMKDLQSGN